MIRAAWSGPRARPSLRIRRSLRSTSTSRPSRLVAVSARIWVSPTAPSRSSLARASGRPALSSRTIPSIRSGSTPAAPAASSTPSRQRCTRSAVATIPPGLFTYTTWLCPAAARRSNSSSRSGSYANGSSSRSSGLYDGPSSRSRKMRPAAAASTTTSRRARRRITPRRLSGHAGGAVADVDHGAVRPQELGLLEARRSGWPAERRAGPCPRAAACS